MQEETAKETLKTAKLKYGNTTTEYSPSIPAGIVIRSDPEGGSEAVEGDTVDLFVSNGMVQVPTVVGQAGECRERATGRVEPECRRRAAVRAPGTSSWHSPCPR